MSDSLFFLRIKRISESCCSGCDYDEVDGMLFSHCDNCCRRITTALFEKMHRIVPKPKTKAAKK